MGLFIQKKTFSTFACNALQGERAYTNMAEAMTCRFNVSNASLCQSKTKQPCYHSCDCFVSMLVIANNFILLINQRHNVFILLYLIFIFHYLVTDLPWPITSQVGLRWMTALRMRQAAVCGMRKER